MMVAGLEFSYNVSVGQLAVGVLVALVGYVLNRRTKHIYVAVNGRMTSALARITALEALEQLHPGQVLPIAAVVTVGSPGPSLDVRPAGD